MIILVTGSRTWKDVQLLHEVLGSEVDVSTDTIIHGNAMGADKLAQEWCDYNGVETRIFKPIDFKNPSYYLHRNAEMVGICDRAIAFCRNQSRGTMFTCKYALARGKHVKFIEVNDNDI